MIDVFNARNQDALHDTALTSEALSAKNTDTWAQSHGLPSQNTTFRHTSTTSQGTQKLPDWVKL